MARPTEKELLESLKSIIDPDLGKDIVSMGLIRKLKIAGDVVVFSINLAPSSPFKEEFKKQAEEIVKETFPEAKTIEVTVESELQHPQRPPGRLEVLPSAKTIVAVGSGKGGVGKSTVAVNLAAALASLGATVGLLDADIYGPSVSMMLKTDEKPVLKGQKIVPLLYNGIHMISMGFLIEEGTPVIWRGPLVSRAIEQLITDVEWPELDYLIIDLPPGTGDAQLTITRRIPLAGAVIVSTPNDVALITAKKGLAMFEKMNVPILGIVENMSYFICPHCKKETEIFIKGKAEEEAKKLNIPCLGKIPIEVAIAESGEKGIPVVTLYPDSETAKAFVKTAKSLVQQLGAAVSK